jgi:hypothetical protein
VKSPEECRAMALLCRQQAPIDPDKHWDLLAQAGRWEYLAERKLVEGQLSCTPTFARSSSLELTRKCGISFL